MSSTASSNRSRSDTSGTSHTIKFCIDFLSCIVRPEANIRHRVVLQDWHFQLVEEKDYRGKAWGDGGLQTVCIREEREYLSLSSWTREGRSEGEEERRWRRREMSKINEQMEEDGNCCLRYKMTFRGQSSHWSSRVQSKKRHARFHWGIENLFSNFILGLWYWLFWPRFIYRNTVS